MSPRSSEVSASNDSSPSTSCAGVHLDPAGAVDQVEERGPAVAAAGGQPAGDAVGGVGLLARLEVVVGGVHRRDRRDARERVRERVDALLAQALELGAAVVDARTLHGAADAYGRPCGLRRRSILVIFSLRAGPRGTGTDDDLAALVAEQRLADRRLVRELAARRGWPRRSRRSCTSCDLSVFWSLTWTVTPTRHDVGVHVLLVDDAGGAQLVLEVGDLLLEHRLLVLGVVVLGVLGDVAELARLLDPLGDLAPALGRRGARSSP